VKTLSTGLANNIKCNHYNGVLSRNTNLKSNTNPKRNPNTN